MEFFYHKSNHCASVARPALSFLISAHSTRYSHNYHNYYRLPLGAATGYSRCRFKLSDCSSYPYFSVAVEQARNAGRRRRDTLCFLSLLTPAQLSCTKVVSLICRLSCLSRKQPDTLAVCYRVYSRPGWAFPNRFQQHRYNFLITLAVSRRF